MRRYASLKPSRRKDPVPEDVAAFVFLRDQGCIAPRLGGSSMDCFGRDRLEHVKVELRAGKRAEPLASRLAVLCEGHTEPGMRAGYVWCTAKVNRNAMREYLRNAPPMENPHEGHIDPCSSTCRDGVVA